MYACIEIGFASSLVNKAGFVHAHACAMRIHVLRPQELVGKVHLDSVILPFKSASSVLTLIHLSGIPLDRWRFSSSCFVSQIYFSDTLCVEVVQKDLLEMQIIWTTFLHQSEIWKLPQRRSESFFPR